MKFHIEKPKLNKELFTKYSTKVILLLTIVFYATLSAINIRVYLLNQNTIKVVKLQGPCIRNQMITKDNLKPYEMTEKEFYRYGLEQSKSGINNRLIKWDDVKILTEGKEPVFFAYSKKNDDLLMWEDCIPTYIDKTRMFRYAYPGKNIIELTVSGSNLNTFKKILQVGDKINIKCLYKKTLSTAVVRSSVKRKSTSESYFDFDLLQIDDLFTNIEIADILNSNGDSILDYNEYVDGLPTSTRLELIQTEEYKRNIKASTLMLAVTPAEESLYNIYRKKDGATFLISLPQAE